MQKVFLSHPHAAPDIAIALASWLERVFRDVDVICTSLPEHHIDAGHMVTTGIVERMKSSSITLALITREALGQPWIFYEMGAAHALGKTFIPCVVRGLSLRDLPPQAHEYQGVDLSDEEGLRRLVKALSHHVGPASVAPEDFITAARAFR